MISYVSFTYFRFLGTYDPTASDDLSSYAVLEDLTLGTLADYHFWDVSRHISEHAIKFVIGSVVSGVSFIHNSGIIFLGVTPHHIGIDNKGSIKLVRLILHGIHANLFHS